MNYLTLTPETIPDSHICCAISDKKCAESYAAKKNWLSEQYAHGYRFRRLDVRGKVFIEYGPAEAAWMPVEAPGWLMLGCFWISGRYKKQGHGKALLDAALEEARKLGCAGLVSVAGKRKMHFQSDGKWFRRQGFREVDALDSGFCLLALEANGAGEAAPPRFGPSARAGLGPDAKGVTVYYSNRCPYSEFHVRATLPETCRKRGLPLTVRKLDSLAEARLAPSPATIFSVFLDGAFITTDLSVCMDNRFDRIVGKALGK